VGCAADSYRESAELAIGPAYVEGGWPSASSLASAGTGGDAPSAVT